MRVWYSDKNFGRRDRAIELAEKLGKSPIHVALAYVLAQPFPVDPADRSAHAAGARRQPEGRSTSS